MSPTFCSRPNGRLSLILALIVFGAVAPAGAQSTGDTDAEAREAQRQVRDRQLEESRTRQLVERFAATTKETGELLTKLEASATALQARLDALLANDDGKRIAQDPVAFMGFVRLKEQPIASIEQIKVRKRNVETMFDALQLELKRVNVGWLPDDKQRREIDGLYFWGKDRLEQIDTQQAWLDTTLGKASKDTDLKKARTLDAVLREYKSRQMELWAKARLEGEAAASEESHKVVSESARLAELEKSKGEAERLLKEAKAQIDLMRSEHELRLKQLEADQIKRQTEMDIKLANLQADLTRARQLASAKRQEQDAQAQVDRDAIQSSARKKLLMQKCQDPEVTSLLAPFTADGYWQPGGGSFSDKKPMSLSKMRSFGALAPNDGGLQRLLECGTRRIGVNKPADAVRPRWSNDPRLFKNKPDQIEELKKAQALLIELGEIMVELNMLSE